MNILLVEDDESVAFLVRRILRPHDASVGWYQDGQSFLQASLDPRQNEVIAAGDLLLLDYHLPDMDAPDLCRRLADNYTGRLPPLVLLGQIDRSEELAHALDSGVTFLLSKDLLSSPDRWTGRLDEILDAEILRPARTFRPIADDSPEPSLGELPQQILRHPSLWPLGNDLLRAMVRRAALPIGPEFAATWIEPDRPTLRAGIRNSTDRLSVHAFLVRFVDVAWCILGTEATLPLCRLLETLSSGG